jgi:uncharacterized protein (TIGR03118 family)
MKIRSTITQGIAAALLVALASCPALADQNQGQQTGVYVQHNLVSDGFVAADHPDATNLVNAWGIAFGPGSPVWVANNGSSTATLYNGHGVAASLVVNITGEDPTGIVWNGSSSFNIAANTPARFIFVTESGTVDAWAGGTSTTVMQTVPGAVFKGVALSGNGSALQLYATDFAGGQVDVFDGSFKLLTPSGNAFKDPNLPAGYNPFGIQAIGGNIYVTFAKTQAGSDDEAHGPGLGFVDVFDPSGNLLHRIASHGVLNAPWGMTLAPAGFGAFSGALLVGNFGDGTINAFNAVHGGYIGTLRDANQKSIKIEGLWGIAFGDGAQEQPVNTLFFAAGPDDEKHGLYGRIDAQGGGDGGGDNQD